MGFRIQIKIALLEFNHDKMALRFFGNVNHPVRKSIVCLHNDKRRYNLVSWTMDDEFFVVDVHVIIICCCYYC